MCKGSHFLPREPGRKTIILEDGDTKHCPVCRRRLEEQATPHPDQLQLPLPTQFSHDPNAFDVVVAKKTE